MVEGGKGLRAGHAQVLSWLRVRRVLMSLSII